MLKVAVIGCGKIAERLHLPEFTRIPDVQVVALCDTRRKALTALADKYGIQARFTDYEKMLRETEVDAVSVCTPNALHAPMTIAAAKAGAHVLVEKPMATTVAEARRMVAAAERAGVVLMVEQKMRFMEFARVARRIIDEGKIGKVITIRGYVGGGDPRGWSPEGKWFFKRGEAGAGPVLDIGIHMIDLMRYLLGGRRVQSICGFGQKLALGKFCEVEDNGVAALQFDGDTLGTITASWTNHPGMTRCEVFGSKGTIIAETEEVQEQYWDPQARKLNVIRHQTSWKYPDGTPLELFVQAIREEKEPPVTGLFGAQNLEVMLGLLESARTHRVVKMKL